MSGLFVLICAITIAALAVWIIHEWSGTIEHDPEQESRRRVLAELADIEMHRPHYIITPDHLKDWTP